MKLKNLSIKLRLKLKKLIIDIRQTHIKDLRNFTLTNIKKIPDVVHLRNLVLFSSILSVVIMAMFVQRFNYLQSYFIKEIPDFGGSYSQGVVGTIEKMNPLFIQGDAENEADKLIFSGLTRTVSATNYVPDLAQSWTISNDGLTYDFKLKTNVKWQDGQKFTANDVVFTINLIENPDTRTNLSQVWRGVTVEKVNDYEVKFKLPNAFPDFLDVANQAILPAHLLQDIDAKNIKLAEFNTDPIGTGPYQFVRFDQIGTQTEVVLDSNKNFAIHQPYIDQIKLILYDDQESLYKGLASRQIGGIADVPLEENTAVSKLANLNLTKNYLPQYEVLDFNYKNESLALKDIRTALAAAVDRQSIVSNALGGNAKEISVPIMPGRSGFDPTAKGIAYDPATANSELEKAGWIKGSDGIRRKDGKILEFRLVYIDNAENTGVVSILKKQFAAIGVKIDLISSDINTISENYIRPRNFDMLLIGQNVGVDEDLYSFWHSSQIADPGLNLTGFSNKEVDKLLEQVRRSSDPTYRADRFKEIQNVIIEEQPALFLYMPLHISALSKEVKGSSQLRISQPADMLNNIYDWYINSRQIR
jgi:peptide/nickel transport system substrate-binding protein